MWEFFYNLVMLFFKGNWTDVQITLTVRNHGMIRDLNWSNLWASHL